MCSHLARWAGCHRDTQKYKTARDIAFTGASKRSKTSKGTGRYPVFGIGWLVCHATLSSMLPVEEGEDSSILDDTLVTRLGALEAEAADFGVTGAVAEAPAPPWAEVSLR